MKVITPTSLLAEAADVLAPVRDEVVVIGAAALQAALAESATLAAATRDVDIVAITPTRDVDVVVPTDRAAAVVAHLEQADMRRSEVDHERSFTWARGDLKVQLVRTFHPPQASGPRAAGQSGFRHGCRAAPPGDGRIRGGSRGAAASQRERGVSLGP